MTCERTPTPYLSPVKHVTTWMPGAGWKRKGERYRANMEQMRAVPHQFVKDQMVGFTPNAPQMYRSAWADVLPSFVQAAGTALPSFTSTMLAGNPPPIEEYRIKMSAASIYSGGADTVRCTRESARITKNLRPRVPIDCIGGVDIHPRYELMARGTEEGAGGAGRCRRARPLTDICGYCGTSVPECNLS